MESRVAALPHRDKEESVSALCLETAEADRRFASLFEEALAAVMLIVTIAFFQRVRIA